MYLYITIPHNDFLNHLDVSQDIFKSILTQHNFQLSESKLYIYLDMVADHYNNKIEENGLSHSPLPCLCNVEYYINTNKLIFKNEKYVIIQNERKELNKNKFPNILNYHDIIDRKHYVYDNINLLNDNNKYYVYLDINMSTDYDKFYNDFINNHKIDF